MISGMDSGAATGNHGICGQGRGQLLLQAGVLFLWPRDAFHCFQQLVRRLLIMVDNDEM